jgi:hypothetical protein
MPGQVGLLCKFFAHLSQVNMVMVCQKRQNANDDSLTVYIVRTRMYWKFTEKTNLTRHMKTHLEDSTVSGQTYSCGYVTRCSAELTTETSMKRPTATA